MDAPIAKKILGACGGPRGKLGEGQTLAITTATAISNAVTGQWMDVVATQPCLIAIASTPTVTTTTGYYLTKNTIVRFPLFSGEKLAVIAASATSSGGALHLHPV